MKLRRTKDFLLAIPWLGYRLQMLYKRYRGWRYNPARHLARIFKNHKEVTVVQIGSNDGSTDDPVYQLLMSHPGSMALLVEPVTHLFSQLRSTYASKPHFKFANIAVGESNGFQPFYYLRPETAQKVERLPHYWSQLGTFNRQHIVNCLGERVENFIEEASLQTLTLQTLLADQGITAIDVLHIDAEGADWMILKQVDLAAFPIRVIMFEVKNLSPSDREAAIEFLSGNYRICDFGQDFFCCRKSTNTLSANSPP